MVNDGTNFSSYVGVKNRKDTNRSKIERIPIYCQGLPTLVSVDKLRCGLYNNGYASNASLGI